MILRRFLKAIQVRENSSQYPRHFKIEEHLKKGLKPQSSHKSCNLMRPCAGDNLHFGLMRPCVSLHALVHYCRQKLMFACFPSWFGGKRFVFFS